MNAFDYFFEKTYLLSKNFLLGPRETITYHDLHESSIKLAAYLNDTIGVNQNILLLAPNSVFFMVAYLGIIKSGNVVVPLNPEIEQNNLDYIQDKCQADLTFTTSHLTAKLRFNSLLVLNEKELESILQSISTIGSFEHETSDQLAEIIFTSGSTGEPKGVMISHKNLIANTGSILEYLHLTDRDTMLVVLPFYYCYGLSLLHTHLRVGGSIVLNNMFIMLGGIINDLKRYKCTGLAGVPTHFQILLRKSDSFKKENFPDLRYVTQAGGKLHNVFISEFIETFPHIRFYVMYGQTEATARLSWLPPEKLPEKIGSCGKGIPGVILKVADAEGNPVKPGETGEILASGNNIMQGYYKDPESTAQTIRNGWLHTGDLATVDDEGFIYLTARKKEIIKVGGRRVSPKEIEEVIVSMPEIIDCSIEAVYDEILGETMKATVVTKEPVKGIMTVTSDSIKTWCAGRLASYKIPQIIELKDKIAISATGKKVKK
ncbi:MAG: acyl--CoA ligase [Bacteroidales bacterium]|nr:acyl--CoA ligase [Bacteroidales bacterium]